MSLEKKAHTKTMNPAADKDGMSESSSSKVIGTIMETFNNGHFEWVINACSSDIFETDYLDSPTISFSSSSWFVRMGLGEEDSNDEEENYYSDEDEDSDDEEKDEDEDWISLYLWNKDSSFKKYMYYSFDMVFQDVQIATEEEIDCFTKEDPSGFPKFIESKKFFDNWSTATNKCIQLTIRIRLKELRLKERETSRFWDTLHKVRREGTEMLRQNYKDLLLHSEDHDLILKVKDSMFKAHRYVMQFRCPVFKSMLSYEMLEKNEGVVEIPDCDPLAFKQFLLYVYTGKIEVLDESNMLNLYFIADKYNMENLKEECSAFIKKSLSVNIISDVIKLALNHSDTSLLEFATRYFISNSKKILVTVGWLSFVKEKPVEANELFIKVSNENSQNSHCCLRKSKDNACATVLDKK